MGVKSRAAYPPLHLRHLLLNGCACRHISIGKDHWPPLERPRHLGTLAICEDLRALSAESKSTIHRGHDSTVRPAPPPLLEPKSVTNHPWAPGRAPHGVLVAAIRFLEDVILFGERSRQTTLPAHPRKFENKSSYPTTDQSQLQSRKISVDIIPLDRARVSRK